MKLLDFVLVVDDNNVRTRPIVDALNGFADDVREEANGVRIELTRILIERCDELSELVDAALPDIRHSKTVQIVALDTIAVDGVNGGLA